MGDLARGLPISRPAVSQHLKHLKDAGLVSDEAVGTRRVYRLDPRGISAVRDWLDQHWHDRMSEFKRFADRVAHDAPQEEEEQP